LVRSIHKILDCPVIINETFRKPKEKPPEKPNYEERVLDLYKRKQAKMHPSFIQDIETTIKHPESTFVFWIHGIKDANLSDESKLLGKENPLHCLIGHGQPNRPTCDDESSTNRIIGALESAGIKAASTRDEAEDYRGWDKKRMSQWFKKSGNGLKVVQSIQLKTKGPY
jgi:hypothetical protein